MTHGEQIEETHIIWIRIYIW